MTKDILVEKGILTKEQNNLLKVELLKIPKLRPCQNKKCLKLVGNRYLYEGLWLCWDCIRIALKKRDINYFKNLRKELKED